MRFLKIALIILFFLVLFLTYHFSSNAPVTANEIFRDDEAAQAQRSIEKFKKDLDTDKTRYVARGAHSKAHACVKAYFKINEDIEQKLQHGLFSLPGQSYKAWIRFSNGKGGMKGNYDTNKDAHGMAVKIINIYENGLEKKSGESETQEFLMHDSPVFFVANINDYNQFLQSEDKILYFVEGVNPFKWHLRELIHALNTLKPPPVSPLNTQYFSNTAYKLGPHNMKFSARSCSIQENESNYEDKGPDFLQEVMSEELANGEGCFDFLVQLQDPNKYMPIEDPSIEWRESDSPFLSLAKIKIPSQKFNSPEQREFCENLSFSPWNSLNTHRPIGELNRIRKKVYQASSNYRHKKNNAEIPTNLDW